MEIKEKEELKNGIGHKYDIYAKELRREFSAKLDLLKQKYKTLSEEEKNSLLEKAKQDKNRWKEISAILEEDKAKFLKRNNELNALRTEYNKAMSDLGTKKSDEIVNIDKRFDYEELVKFRNNGVNRIQREYEIKNAKCDAYINEASRRARKIQEFINAKSAELDKIIAQISETCDAKYKELCEQNKHNPAFTKKRIVIPKELLSETDGKISILQSDLDKCVITSKKDMAFNLCQQKKATVISAKQKMFRDGIAPYLEELEKLKQGIEKAEQKKKELLKERETRFVLFKKKVASKAAEKGITKIEKYDSEIDSDKNSVSKSTKRYKAKHKNENRLIGFIKGTSLYKKISESSSSKKEKKIEKMASEIEEMSKIAASNEKIFFSNLTQGVVENPIYQNNTSTEISHKNKEKVL